MTKTTQLVAVFLKLASEEDPVAQMKARVKALEESGLPKGLPVTPGNLDETDADYATEKDIPVDKGWSSVQTPTGRGGGPKI